MKTNLHLILIFGVAQDQVGSVAPHHPTEHAGVEPGNVHLAPVVLHLDILDRALGLLSHLCLNAMPSLQGEQHVTVLGIAAEVLHHVIRAGLMVTQLAPLIIGLSEPQLNLT